MFSHVRSDFGAILERDPAARGFLERLLCYSGFHALLLHRFAHWLHAGLRLRLLARLVSQFGRFLTGVEIHPGATIGHGVFIDHGMGVVIGETTIVGDNCTLFQGVTLGGTGKETGKRHPTLEEGVVVGTGAKVLGNVRLGRYARIGAGSVVVTDVPAEATVVGVPGRVVIHAGAHFSGATLDHGNLPDPVRNALEDLHEEIKRAEAEMRAHQGFLTEMRECKLREVGFAEARAPQAELEPKARAAAAGRRSFRKALEAPGIAVIAECKQASPSAGVIVPDYDPVRLAQAYQRGGARALSVLTDRCHFQGSLQDLIDARAAVALPVLRKDFLLTPYHLYQSAAAGADAVLLIVSFLRDWELAEMAKTARELGLDALVEVHNEVEVARALDVGAEIIGINNRNLDRMTTKVENSLRLAPLVPDDKLLVAESGIKTREEVRRLEDAGFDAVLVGHSLLKQTDQEQAVRELIAPGPGASTKT
jgi:serine O-acetyltransferase